MSRKLPAPLAVLVQSASAAGKSALQDACLSFVPEHERVKYSAVTGQSLFYVGETDLRHKVLAIAESEGALQAAYALKLLQSEGELTLASTAKDPQTGQLATRTYRVKGPVMLLLTTTAAEPDEELLNRCLVLAVNESREQTKAIHAAQRQRRTLDGRLAQSEHEAILQRHRHAQRLLEPLPIVNPYAERLTFVDGATRTRRDHEKYLTLIDTLALLHQRQRPRRTAERRGRTLTYIEAALDDIETANRLAHEVLGRTLDELPPQTRRLLRLISSGSASRPKPKVSRAAPFASAAGNCVKPSTGATPSSRSISPGWSIWNTCWLTARPVSPSSTSCSTMAQKNTPTTVHT